MPVIVRDLDDDAATIIMVDSNLQRESLLPSERAFAYKMKLDAMKHQGARTDLTSAQVGPKLTAAEKIAENSPDSKSQIKRFIRLTELVPELMDMVDEKKIAFNPAYELSFLKKEEQVDLLDAMDSEQATPSLSQAQRLKKFSQEGHLSIDVMRAIMSEEKKSELDTMPTWRIYPSGRSSYGRGLGKSLPSSPNFRNRGINPICGGRNGVLFAAPSSVFSFAHILVFLKCWKDNMGRKQIAAKELRIDENL